MSSATFSFRNFTFGNYSNMQSRTNSININPALTNDTSNHSSHPNQGNSIANSSNNSNSIERLASELMPRQQEITYSNHQPMNLYEYQSNTRNEHKAPSSQIPLYQEQYSSQIPLYQEQYNSQNFIYQEQYSSQNQLYQEQSSTQFPLYQEETSSQIQIPLYQEESISQIPIIQNQTNIPLYDQSNMKISTYIQYNNNNELNIPNNVDINMPINNNEEIISQSSHNYYGNMLNENALPVANNINYTNCLLNKIITLINRMENIMQEDKLKQSNFIDLFLKIRNEDNRIITKMEETKAKNIEWFKKIIDNHQNLNERILSILEKKNN